MSAKSLTKQNSLRCTVLEIWVPHEKTVTGNYRPVTGYPKMFLFYFSEPKDDRDIQLFAKIVI